MRERIFTTKIVHPDRVKLAPDKQYVALVIWNREKKVLLAKRSNKERWSPGMWSIITETREPVLKELVRGTVIRGLKEELGKDKREFIIPVGSYRYASAAVYQAIWGYPATIRGFQTIFKGDMITDPNIVFQYPREEIEQLAWVYPDQLNYYEVEPEARYLVNNCINYNISKSGLIFPSSIATIPTV